MTGNGSPRESPDRTQSDPRSGVGSSDDRTAAADQGPSDGSERSGGSERPDVAELEARLDQKDASLQNVIDRYEALIERRRDEGPDGSDGPASSFADAAQKRLDRLRADVEILLNSRRP